MAWKAKESWRKSQEEQSNWEEESLAYFTRTKHMINENQHTMNTQHIYKYVEKTHVTARTKILEVIEPERWCQQLYILIMQWGPFNSDIL